jgi:hypothetical protein
MNSFFVLGLIPGTTIQITFEMWIFIIADTAGLLLLANMVGLRRRKQLIRSVARSSTSHGDKANAPQVPAPAA